MDSTSSPLGEPPEAAKEEPHLAGLPWPMISDGPNSPCSCLITSKRQDLVRLWVKDFERNISEMLSQSARRTATRLARLFPQHFEEACVAQQSRTLSSCVTGQPQQSSFLRNDLYRSLTYQTQHSAMCDISKRPGQTLHPAVTKRSLSTIIYPPSEAKVGGPAPDFSAPGAT